MDRRQHSLLEHRPQRLEKAWLFAAWLVLFGQVGCDGDPEDSAPPDTHDPGPDWLADPRCGVEGVPSDGAPLGVVSLGESEMIGGGKGGLFTAGDQNGDGCTDVAFATGGDFDASAGTTRIFSGPVTGDIDIEHDWTVTLVGEPDDWAFEPFTGDVNGDGAADWIIGGSEIQDGLGGVYVAFGPVTTSLELGSEADALLLGENDLKGGEDHEATDLDGDGFDDLLVGVPGHVTQEGHTTGVISFQAPSPAADRSPTRRRSSRPVPNRQVWAMPLRSAGI